MSSDAIHAVSFDLWSTLLKGNTAFTVPRVRLMLKELGCEVRGQKASNVIADRDLLRAFRSSKRYYDENSELTGNDYGLVPRLKAIFAELDINPWPHLDIATVTALEAKLLQERLKPEFMPTFIEHDLISTLQYLRYKGYRIGLLSNTGMESHIVMRPVLEALGILQYFDVAMFSSEEAKAKPNKALYLDLAERLGAAPGNILHVGDSQPADYHGAISAGFQARLFLPSWKSDIVHVSSIRQVCKELPELSSQPR